MKVKNDIWLKNLVFASLRRLPNKKIREPQNFDIFMGIFHSDPSRTCGGIGCCGNPSTPVNVPKPRKKFRASIALRARSAVRSRLSPPRWRTYVAERDMSLLSLKKKWADIWSWLVRGSNQMRKRHKELTHHHKSYYLRRFIGRHRPEGPALFCVQWQRPFSRVFVQSAE